MKPDDPRVENLRRLGLPPEAAWEEVQSRYRQLVLSSHPDANPTRAAAERFREIAAAYESLSALRRERRFRSEEEVIRMTEDPRIRSLPAEELVMRLRHSSSAQVRAAAAWLLGRVDRRETRRLLLDAVRDPDDLVRRIALEALGGVGRMAEFRRLLPAAFASGGPETRAVRRCLGRIVGRVLAGRAGPTAAERPFAWGGR